MKKSFWPYIIIFFICFIGFAIKAYNINEAKNVDEANIVKRAVYIADGKMHIEWYNWPAQSLMRINAVPFKLYNYYTNISREKKLTVKEQYKKATQTFNTIAHYTTLFFSIFATLLIFLIGKKAGKTSTGLLAALFLSASYLFTLHSRFATPDVPMTAALLGMIFISLKILDLPINKKKNKKEWAWYGCAGLIFGFLLATKYTGALGVVPIGLVWFYRFGTKNKWNAKSLMQNSYKLLNWSVLFFIIGFIVTHSIFNPFFIADLDLVKKAILFESKGDRITATWSNNDNIFWQNLRYYIKSQPTWNGLIVALLALGGCFSAILAKTKKNLIWYGLIIYGTIIVISLSVLKLHWSRWAVPIIPFISLLAAFFVTDSYSRIIKKINRRKIIFSFFSIIVTLALIPQLFLGIISGYALNSPSTNDRMKDYIKENIPTETKIMVDSYNFKMKNYNIATDNLGIYKTSVSDYKNNNYSYIIVKSDRRSAAKAHSKKFAYILDFFNDLENQGELVKTFKSYDGILKAKKDTKFYPFIWKHGIKDIENITTGATLSLYKLK